MDKAASSSAEKQPGRFKRWLLSREQWLIDWETADPKRAAKRKGKGCYHAYTHLFLPAAILVLLGLPFMGRELIWSIDGLSQYYPFFIYEGQYIREIFSNLLSGNGLVLPLWEWHSGYGADIPTTFDVMLDPLNLVSAITPPFLSEWVFQLLVVVRMYLAGLAFVYYCRVRGENRSGTVLAALLYALCGAGLVGVRWSSGLHAFILFPIILAGAERIFQGRKPWVFVASLTMLTVVSYYFAYSACFLLVGYLAVRAVMEERPNLTVGRFMRWVGIFAGLVVLSIVLAGFALLPAVYSLAGLDRVTDSSVAVPLFYSAGYYFGLITQFLSITEVGSDTYQGFGGFAFLACLALFVKRGKNKELKLVFVVLSVMFLIPIVGSFFNGMNYATNRWAWAYAMCVAFIVARVFPDLMELDSRSKRALVIGTALYALVFLVPAMRIEQNVAGYVALLVALLVLLTVRGAKSRRRMAGCAIVLTLAVSGFYFLSADEGGMGKQQVPLASAYKKLFSDSTDSMALDANDASWWRYDAAQAAHNSNSPMNRSRNNSLVLDLNGIDFYNSVYDGGVDRFHTDLAIAGDDVNFSYLNLQGRGDLMALLGVKYYAYRNDGGDAAPQGFVKDPVAQKNIAGIDYQLLKSDTALPIGFTYDRALSLEDYQSLSPAERQQVLLQAVVLEHPSANGESGAKAVDPKSLEFESSSLPFKVANAEGVIVEDGRFVVQNPGARLTLEFNGVPNAETYLYVSGFNYRALKPSEFRSEEEITNMAWYFKADLMMRDLSFAAPVNYEIMVRSDVSPLAGFLTNYVPGFHMYGGKDTWLVNTGYSDKPAHSLTISFDVAGEYTFKDLQVVAETHGKQHAWVAERAATTLENAELGCNKLTGSVDLAKPETLLVTVAHGNGWTAYVDGEQAELLRGNEAFLSLNLPAGRHDVEFRYMTPGLLQGWAMTGVGVVALLVLIVFLRRRGKRDGEAEPAAAEAGAGDDDAKPDEHPKSNGGTADSADTQRDEAGEQA